MRPRRFSGVLYHQSKKVAVDLVVHRDPRFKEPWYLLVPAGSEHELFAEEIVRLYAERMQIEQRFRDWKTHLGVLSVLSLSRLMLATAPLRRQSCA